MSPPKIYGIYRSICSWPKHREYSRHTTSKSRRGGTCGRFGRYRCRTGDPASKPRGRRTGSRASRSGCARYSPCLLYTSEQMAKNIRTFEEDKPLNEQEMKTLLGIASEMVKKIALPCTACRYCVSHCPQGLDIPSLLALYNEHCFTGGGFIAPMALSAVPEEKRPTACIGCRSCEAVCPQQIRISEAMADFAQRLGA